VGNGWKNALGVVVAITVWWATAVPRTEKQAGSGGLGGGTCGIVGYAE